MSPSAALHDHAFRVFVLVIFGALAASGAVLAVLSYGFKVNVAKVWTIWRSWLVMGPLGLAFAFGGRWVWVGGVAVVALVAFNEYARATGLYRDWLMTGAAMGAILAGAGACAGPDWDAGGQRPGAFDLFEALPVYAVGLFLLVPVVRNRSAGQLQQVAVAIVGFVLIGWMFMHVAFMANATNPYGPLVYLVFATEVNDIAAYTFGRLLGRPGRHALRSNISPNKTWEGAVGALAVSMGLPWALSFAFPPEFGWGAKVLVGLIVGVGGQVGDLAVSVIKRDVGVKDMGTAIPGHGGVLDRIDSLLFTAPLFLRLMHFYGLVR